MKAAGYIKDDDTVVVTAGIGASGRGSTNLMQIEKVFSGSNQKAYKDEF